MEKLSRVESRDVAAVVGMNSVIDTLIKGAFGPVILDHITRALQDWANPSWGPAKLVDNAQLYIETLLQLTETQANAAIQQGLEREYLEREAEREAIWGDDT